MPSRQPLNHMPQNKSSTDPTHSPAVAKKPPSRRSVASYSQTIEDSSAVEPRENQDMSDAENVDIAFQIRSERISYECLEKTIAFIESEIKENDQSRDKIFAKKKGFCSTW